MSKPIITQTYDCLVESSLKIRDIICMKPVILRTYTFMILLVSHIINYGKKHNMPTTMIIQTYDFMNNHYQQQYKILTQGRNIA
jgi:hypothetical protein